MTRRARIWLGGIAAFAVLAVLAVHFFDWNLLRGPIARRVEQATGRSFAINGNLGVQLSLKPRIRAESITFGNAPWGSAPEMLQIARLEFRFDALALLRGHIALDQVVLTEPRALIERNKAGAANWELGGRKKPAAPPPEIRSLLIEHGLLRYRDAKLDADVDAQLDSVPAGSPDAGRVKVDAHGRFRGMPASLQGTLGSVLMLEAADSRYPVRLRAKLGSTAASVDGVLFDPVRLRGEDLGFDLQGSDLARLFPIIGVPLPPTPAYRLSGHLNHTAAQWSFRGFSGRVGGSDLSGDFSVDRSRTPQSIKANLVSRRLDMADLGGFIGGSRGEKSSPIPPAPGRVLPREPFSLEKLRIANAEVRFRGESVITQKLPLERLDANLKLKDGRLTLEPLSFSVADGTLDSRIRMDARQSVIGTQADIRVKGLHLEKLFPGFKLSRANAGEISGRAQLSTTGNSIAGMLGSADGPAELAMQGGSVSELLVRLMNLDVANALPVLLTGDRQLPVRCLVAGLDGTQGRFQVRTLVLDTGKAIVKGTGSINFADESLDLKLASQSKSFSLAALRGPILVRGTFKDPQVRPDFGRVIGRGGIAALLGIATGGLAAFVPLLDFGGAESSNCAALIQEAQAPAEQAPDRSAPQRRTPG